MKKKAFAYLTTIDLTDTAAQSLQTGWMIYSFRKLLGGQFTLFSDRKYSNSYGEYNASFNVADKFRNRFLRQLFVLLAFIIKKKKCFFYVVTAREVMLALGAQFFSSKVILELHQVPSLKVIKLLHLFSSQEKLVILSISYSLKDKLVELLPGLEIIVEHDGVSLADYEGLRLPVGYSHSKPITVTYTGSLYKGNDVYLVAQAARLFPELEFKIYGGRSEEVLSLSKDGEFVGLHNLRLMGRVDRHLVPAIQTSSDILFFPLTKSNKLWDVTSPLKLFEYMAASSAIVASRIGTVEEVLSEREAYLFNPSDQDSLVSALGEAIADIKNGDKRRQLEARKKVEEYTWDQRVERIVKLC